MLCAWHKGGRGERYILGGENLTYREAIARIASVGGAPAPTWRMPRPIARALGWAGDLSERSSDREPLINSVTVGYGFCPDFVFSSAKAQRELGYQSGPLEPAIGAAIAWFREQGMLR